MDATVKPASVRARSSTRAVGNPASLVLDDLDNGIIQMLRENGRATNLDIAEKLGVTASTVSIRIKRLEDNKAMKVVAGSDFSAHGFDVLMGVGIKVNGRNLEAIAADLTALPEVFALHKMNGRFDLEMLVALKNFDAIGSFMADHVAKVKGVAEVESAVAYDIVKFEFNVVPL